jgi:UDP-3-O-[3-hydroxymyristoyl] glucosamine N-acyltransferase
MTISNKTKIGKNVSISSTAKIFDNVIIEDNVKIGDFCSIGFTNNPDTSNNLIIKNNVNINSHSIIYNNSTIGENTIIGHNVLIREKTIIENNVQVGSYSDIEGHSKIEQYVKIHSNVHIGQHSNIMSFSWLFPYVILTNDPIPPSDIRQGVIIEPFSILCTRSTILPGKIIHFGAFVGANSLVNIDLKAETIGSGNPFKQRGSINLIKIPDAKLNAYPWISRFKKDYPEDIEKIYKDLRKKFIK